jgi:hypothetical protein
MNMNLLYGMLFFALGHIGAFLQLNGQFKWDWFAKNEWIIAAFGVLNTQLQVQMGYFGLLDL